MNYLVFLDSRAGELEKILSGVKTMLVKEFDPARTPGRPVQPGDSLYFLRDQEECSVRVKASVVRALFFASCMDEGLSRGLKEMQSRLQLTEDQYNTWSARKNVLLVEFEAAQKIDVIQVSLTKTSDRSDWIAFENIDWISE